jgi:ketosteroid isomerase-like protein
LKQVDLKTEELTTRGDLAIEVGAWTSAGQTQGGKQWSADGKYVVAWKTKGKVAVVA